MEQLYTARGAQGVGLDAYIAEKTFVDPEVIDSSTLLLQFKGNISGIAAGGFAAPVRALWTTKDRPDYVDTHMSNSYYFMVSIPLMSFFSDQPVDSMNYTSLAI